MITKKEIEVQIALGVVSTPQQIAQLVRKTTDAGALDWAVKYKNTKVRRAAINNDALHISSLIWACAFETSKTCREALGCIVSNRCIEITEVLDILKYYPQLSMDLRDESTS